MEVDRLTALGDVLVVSEFEHEFVARFCELFRAEPPFLAAFREAEVRNGGGHHMEGWRIISSREQGQDFQYFDETPWP